MDVRENVAQSFAVSRFSHPFPDASTFMFEKRRANCVVNRGTEAVRKDVVAHLTASLLMKP
jgi:hypothetical protein